MQNRPTVSPTAAQLNQLRAISCDVLTDAAAAGYASSRFQGYRIAGVRSQLAEPARGVDLMLEHESEPGHLLHAWHAELAVAQPTTLAR